METVPRSQLRWAGLSAILGGVAAIVMTAPFATAFFLAYPGANELPFWFDSVEPLLEPLVTFASPVAVYDAFGRAYNPIYLLLIPIVVVLHRAHLASPSRLEKSGYVVLISGLIATTIGVAGDYWGNGIGFPVEMLGLLAMIIGATMWGISLVRRGIVPPVWAWLVLLSGPGAFASMALIGHVPSGPTLPFAFAWLVVGVLAVSARHDSAHQRPASP